MNKIHASRTQGIDVEELPGHAVSHAYRTLSRILSGDPLVSLHIDMNALRFIGWIAGFIGVVAALIALVELDRKRHDRFRSRGHFKVTRLGFVLGLLPWAWVVGCLVYSVVTGIRPNSGYMLFGGVVALLATLIVMFTLNKLGYATSYWQPVQANQPLHPTPSAGEAPASGAGERRR